ncbi:MAG: MqnA/MqnD/SBP family protein [Candidatus Kapaibacterium sp.]
MKIKIAIPDNSIYRELFFNADAVCKEFGISLIRTTEREVAKLFENNRVDVAFLSPMDYGRGTRISDYRIVPANVYAVNGYSRIASTFFKPGLKTITSCGSPSPNDFIMSIGKILLAERYNIIVDLAETKSEKKDEILAEFDSAMLWKKNFADDTALDITEDWLDTYDMPLVMGTWVTRHEEEPEDLVRILRLFESDSLHGTKKVTDKPNEEYDPREGEILYTWDEEMEKSYDALLEILFYHQLTNEMATVKIMGDELTSPTEDSIIFSQGKEEDESQ